MITTEYSDKLQTLLEESYNREEKLNNQIAAFEEITYRCFRFDNFKPLQKYAENYLKRTTASNVDYDLFKETK